MPLVASFDLLRKARAGGYAIGGFNVNNMEILQGIIEAAAELRSPVILQVSAGARKYARPAFLSHMVKAAVESTGVTVTLHLDHGESLELAKQCIDGGFTSVMIDSSAKPFEENVEITSSVVEYAHARGVQVEAEIGRLQGVEDDVRVGRGEASYTDAAQAAEFVRRTGCDSLAVAIGTSHGAYKFSGEPHLELGRLEEITRVLPPGFPIVLHGASSVPAEAVAEVNRYGGRLSDARGVPEEAIRQAIRRGVAKVNMDTDLRLAMTASVRKVLTETPEEFDPRKYLGAGRDAIKALVAHKITDVLGSVGKA